MKKYILGLGIIVFSLTSCNDNDSLSTENLSLQEQKAQIEKEIDSLNKILIKIDKELGQSQKEEIAKIDAEIVKAKDFTHYIELQGSVDTDGNVMVVPEAMGKIKRIYKNEGDKVRKGELIMSLDDSTIRSQISEVYTQYELAKTGFERQKRLWDQKIGSEMAYLQAKTKKEALARKLGTLRSQLKKMSVTAPISGTIDDMMAKSGEMAAPQKPVARVVNLSKVYMQADVSEKYLPKIKKGTQTLVEFPELNKEISSTVSYVGNFIHPNNRTFKIRIDILNPNKDLKPNLTGNIKIKDFEKEQALVLPLSLVQEDRSGNNYVFVLNPVDGENDNYKVQKRVLKLGPSYKGEVLIESGLQAGDIIALQGTRGLAENDKVKLTKKIEVVENQQEKIKNQQNETQTHIVQKGETLFRIHKKYNVSLSDLKKWNHLKGNDLLIGQKLIIKNPK